MYLAAATVKAQPTCDAQLNILSPTLNSMVFKQPFYFRPEFYIGVLMFIYSSEWVFVRVKVKTAVFHSSSVYHNWCTLRIVARVWPNTQIVLSPWHEVSITSVITARENILQTPRNIIVQEFLHEEKWLPYLTNIWTKKYNINYYY